MRYLTTFSNSAVATEHESRIEALDHVMATLPVGRFAVISAILDDDFRKFATVERGSDGVFTVRLVG